MVSGERLGDGAVVAGGIEDVVADIGLFLIERQAANLLLSRIRQETPMVGGCLRKLVAPLLSECQELSPLTSAWLIYTSVCSATAQKMGTNG
jgi:hypothetical protein